MARFFDPRRDDAVLHSPLASGPPANTNRPLRLTLPSRRYFPVALGTFLLALTFNLARAGVPDVTNSFYVPQAGTVASPIEGTLATRLFRMCPNNDGGASSPNNARVKVVALDVNDNPIAGIASADICLLFNGGTAAQGFSGVGADSVIANSTWNQDPLCPDVRCVQADAPTDANGVAYITFAGASPTNPGVALRDANRKWGHYDTEIPVYVLGFKISGRLTSASMNGTYTLRIKNFDVTEGLDADLNEGEAVTAADLAAIIWGIGVVSPISYWLDFDSSGLVTTTDLNLLLSHFNHDCAFPNNP